MVPYNSCFLRTTNSSSSLLQVGGARFFNGILTYIKVGYKRPTHKLKKKKEISFPPIR